MYFLRLIQKPPRKAILRINVTFFGARCAFCDPNSKVGKVTNPTLGDKVGSRIESPNRRHIFSGRRIFRGSLLPSRKRVRRRGREDGGAKALNGHFGPRRYLTDLTLTRASRFSSRIEPWVVFPYFDPKPRPGGKDSQFFEGNLLLRFIGFIICICISN